MKYFLHDSNAFNDEKVTQLFIKYGYEGVGLFYTILEKLSLQEKPVLTSVLKHQLKVGKRLNKCWNFMESIELISSNNGETFNKQLLNFSEKYLIKKEKNKERIAEWRKNQQDSENVTRNKSVRNTPKDKISKDNISKGTDPENGSYKKFVDLWFLFYEKQTELKFDFKAIHGKKIKSIIAYLENLSKDKNFTGAELFEQILNKWNLLDDWEQKNYLDLSVLDQKLPIIVNQLKTKSNLRNGIYSEMEQKYGASTN